MKKEHKIQDYSGFTKLQENKSEIEPINLIEKYKEDEYTYHDLKDKCLEWLDKQEGITDKSKEYMLKKGDIILFKNGYGIPFITEVLGFDETGLKAYLYWDCYWFPLDIGLRLIKRLS
jgi:hypothetical protein